MSRLDQILDHRDYAWARLPFVVPMAAAAARRHGDAWTSEIARLVGQLCALVLPHLEAEEPLLARTDFASAVAWIRDGRHADHIAIAALLERIRDLDCLDSDEASDRMLHRELVELAAHVEAQIELEEQLIASRLLG